jgi:hypothetical protein
MDPEEIFRLKRRNLSDAGARARGALRKLRGRGLTTYQRK